MNDGCKCEHFFHGIILQRKIIGQNAIGYEELRNIYFFYADRDVTWYILNAEVHLSIHTSVVTG